MQNAKSIFIIILLIGSLIAFVGYLYLGDNTNIQVVELKKGVFEITNKTQVLELNNLKSNTKYNIVLRFYRDANIDISRLIDSKSIYSIQTELIDINNNITDKIEFNQNNQAPGSYTNDYFEWHVVSFTYNNNIARMKLILTGNDKFFDNMKKEIFIEKLYDPAAMPFLIFVKKVLLVVSILLFVFAGLLWSLKLSRRQPL